MTPPPDTPIPNGWRLTKLGDVATVNRGLSWSREQESPIPVDGSIPVIRIGNVQPDGFSMADVLHIKDVSIADAERRRVSQKTLVMVGSNGNPDRVGNVFLARPELDGFALASFLIGIDPVPTISERFLGLLMRSNSIQSQITDATSGSTGLKNLGLTWLRSLPILLPPLPEQRRIAEILDSIDEAIEREKAVVIATERLRDAMLHELLTRGIPGRHTEYRDVPGLGTIPACWEMARLGDVCEKITKGTTPTTVGREYVTAGVRFLRVENISDYGAIIDGELRFIDEETHRKFSRSILKENDVVLSIAGALGRSALIPSSILPANINQALSVVRLEGEAGILPNFLVLAFRAWTTQLQIAEMRAELAQANLNLQQVADLRITVPALPEQQDIADMLDGVESTIELARTHVSILRSVKESAADALLTGKVRVRGSKGMRKE